MSRDLLASRIIISLFATTCLALTACDKSTPGEDGAGKAPAEEPSAAADREKEEGAQPEAAPDDKEEAPEALALNTTKACELLTTERIGNLLGADATAFNSKEILSKQPDPDDPVLNPGESICVIRDNEANIVARLRIEHGFKDAAQAADLFGRRYQTRSTEEVAAKIEEANDGASPAEGSDAKAAKEAGAAGLKYVAVEGMGDRAAYDTSSRTFGDVTTHNNKLHVLVGPAFLTTHVNVGEDHERNKKLVMTLTKKVVADATKK